MVALKFSAIIVAALVATVLADCDWLPMNDNDDYQMVVYDAPNCAQKGPTHSQKITGRFSAWTLKPNHCNNIDRLNDKVRSFVFQQFGGYTVILYENADCHGKHLGSADGNRLDKNVLAENFGISSFRVRLWS
ncbi:hypothetical protein BJ138DRAFT_1102898 [Hygrophoropsis aurantiaca]|uniref:Uncharacterized protein n=1 Tax=Hygrophoropsis aurantiaca TaxID=72124 RepID=A0ACB8A919_9AGAM|nr:hypothetical protein BJ138DRAFT_1102898 [Hygrophoropsis aurantiaca]